MSLSETLNQARQQASPDPARPLSFRIIRDKVMPLLLEHTPTEQAIRNLHTPDLCPKRPDPLTLWALAQVYEVDVAEIDPDTATTLAKVIELDEARRRHPRQGRRGPARNVPSEQRQRENPGTRVSAGQVRRVA